MLGELTPPERLKKSEMICKNCKNIFDEDDVMHTEDDREGCDDCIENCRCCGDAYFTIELNSHPYYYPKTCDKCLNYDELATEMKNDLKNGK